MNSDRLDAAGLLARFAALHPVAATATGIHDHDGEWDGFGAAADARVLAWVDEETARLRCIPEGALDQDDLADRDLALATLAGIRFERTEIRTTAWDPLNIVATVGGGLFPLIARTFGSREQRVREVDRAAGRDAQPLDLATPRGAAYGELEPRRVDDERTAISRDGGVEPNRAGVFSERRTQRVADRATANGAFAIAEHVIGDDEAATRLGCEMLEALLAEFGVEWAPHKQRGPCSVIEF
jgi:hypothetical protein